MAERSKALDSRSNGRKSARVQISPHALFGEFKSVLELEYMGLQSFEMGEGV